MCKPLTVALTAVGALALWSGSTAAQAPTEAQQQAIRSSCVADYRSHCAQVPPHGMQALACLQQHEASLSPGCKSAVDAIGGGSSAASAPATNSSDKQESTEDDTAAAATSQSAAEKPAADAATGAASSSPSSGHSSRPELSFRQEVRLAAGACARDFRLFCPNLPVGHGNVLFCLKVNEPKLDPPCRNALVEAGATF